MNYKTIVGVLLLGSIAAVTVLSNKKDPVTDKQVVKPTISRTTTIVEKLNKSYPVSNLSVDPSQVIIFNVEVTQPAVEITIQRLRELDKKKKDVYLLIDSPGGSVFDGSRLIAYMEGANIKVNTICYSLCASMAAQIHAHGKQRYVVDHSTLMYHQAAGGVQGSLKEMTNQLNYVNLEVAKLDAYIAMRAGITRETFDKMVEHELWIAADDAVDQKLADKLVILSLTDNNAQVFSVGNELTKKNISVKSTINITNPLQNIY